MNLTKFNVVQPQEQPKEEVNSAVKMANISIRVDANCFLLCDGEFTEIELQAGKITKLQLPAGQHLLEFVDIEYPDLKMEKVVDWPDEGKSYLVLVDKFKKVVEKAKAEAERKAKAEAERKAKEEAEREAKEKAEREKPIEYEVEECVYKLYPATYTAALIETTGREKNIVVLKTISYLDNNYSVTEMKAGAFDRFETLESIVIPDSVTSIGMSAFYYCKSLTSVVIPEGVKSIKKGTFYGCKSLTSIVIPESVKSIGEEAFRGCEKLKAIIFKGTKEQWRRIEKHYSWAGSGCYDRIPASIKCTDGDARI